jgi:hypothetical protein
VNLTSVSASTTEAEMMGHYVSEMRSAGAGLIFAFDRVDRASISSKYRIVVMHTVNLSHQTVTDAGGPTARIPPALPCQSR